MAISGITTPLSSLKDFTVKVCFFTFIGSSWARSPVAIRVALADSAASRGRRGRIWAMGWVLSLRGSQCRDWHGAECKPCAIRLGADEQEADQATDHQQAAQDGVAELITRDRIGGVLHG